MYGNARAAEVHREHATRTCSSGLSLILARVRRLFGSATARGLACCVLGRRQHAMTLDWKHPEDPARLRELVASESNAKQRDRYRAVLLAGAGRGGGGGQGGDRVELTREQIAATVGRARQFVDQWVGRYRRSGLDALRPRKQRGAAPKLTAEQQRELRAMLEAGPAPDEGLAAYNGPVLRERIRERFGTLYSLPGVYHLLHRLGYNDLMPRTTHPDTDPARQDAFKKRSCPSGSTPPAPRTRASGC
jgi:transposase